MNPTIWAALIGLVGTILSGLIPFLLLRKRSARNEIYDKITGSITNPKPDQIIGRTFECSGIVTGMQPNVSLWLAVEAGGYVWPKENKVFIDKDNNWSVTSFEDGSSDIFSVALFVADAEADKRIMRWLKLGRSTGNYSELKGIPTARRIARIDGLRLKKVTS